MSPGGASLARLYTPERHGIPEVVSLKQNWRLQESPLLESKEATLTALVSYITMSGINDDVGMSNMVRIYRFMSSQESGKGYPGDPRFLFIVLVDVLDDKSTSVTYMYTTISGKFV